MSAILKNKNADVFKRLSNLEVEMLDVKKKLKL